MSYSLWPMNCSPLGSSDHGIFQARILEQVVDSFSKGSSWSKDWTSCLLHLLHWQAGSLPLFHLGLSPEGLSRHKFPWFCENPYSLVNIKKKKNPSTLCCQWEINSRHHILISSWIILLSFPSSRITGKPVASLKLAKALIFSDLLFYKLCWVLLSMTTFF